MKRINQIIFIFSLFITCLSHAMLPDLHQADLYRAVEGGNLEQVQQLLDRGANVNAADKFGLTPLHMAAEKGSEAIVRLLLDRGANVNAIGGFLFGYSPLHCAELFNHTEVATLLRHWRKYQNLIKERKKQMFAFLMAIHPRLGDNSPANVLPRELFSHTWQFVRPTIEKADNFEE